MLSRQSEGDAKREIILYVVVYLFGHQERMDAPCGPEDSAFVSFIEAPRCAVVHMSMTTDISTHVHVHTNNNYNNNNISNKFIVVLHKKSGALSATVK